MKDVSHYVSLCFDEEVGRIDKRNLKKERPEVSASKQASN